MDLQGKVAVVTGGAVRVGRALTLALAGAGCDVFIHYGRSSGPAEQTAAHAQALGVQTHLHSANLTQADDCLGLIPAAVERFGQVDILVNSAAIFPERDQFAETDAELFDRLFALNLRAPFLLSQGFAAQLPQDANGKIINMLDARLNRPLPDHFVYRLAKGGLWQMTQMLALELAPRITVNAVALGAILPPPGQGQEYLDRMAQEQVPLRRAGNTEIVTQNVLHLLTQDFLTGVIIPIDGGQFL